MNRHSFGFSKLRVAPALAMLAAAALIAPCAAQATPLVIHMVEQGGNVVATGSGSIDMTGLSNPQAQSYLAQVGGAGSYVFVGDYTSMVQYQGTITGPSSFGPGVGVVADNSNGSGDPIGIWAQGNFLYVPAGYVSGAPLSGSATWSNQTFASLGITPGSYTWTWGAGADQSFTLDIGTLSVPEPAALGMFGLGLLLLGGFVTLRRRESLAA